MAVYGFGKSDVGRISKAVKTVEGLNLTPQSIAKGNAVASNCSSDNPTSVNPNTLAADGTTWNVADNEPLTITIQVRTVWDSTNAILYGYSRTFTYSTCGILTSLSAETRYAIDTAEVCWPPDPT